MGETLMSAIFSIRGERKRKILLLTMLTFAALC